jgi:glucokinase
VRTPASWVVVGLDNGGTCNNATVLDATGQFLVEQLVETPSRVLDGPAAAVEALVAAYDAILEATGTVRTLVRAIGLDTPGPASATGVISAKGSTNFSMPAWRNFDIRGALEARLGLPVVYSNDADAAERSSISAIVGTGLGGGVIVQGRAITGTAGMAGELGHVHIPMQGLLADGQPVPQCNCGFAGDAESVASLTGITKNLLPYWLSRFPDHDLATVTPIAKAARMLRGYGEKGDALAIAIFEQQAAALGRLFTIAANVTDPDGYFVGGGVVEAAPHFRSWFLDRVREHTALREEQARTASFALVPDLDMAGARGAAVAALETVQPR